jgi:hypothetical protein
MKCMCNSIFLFSNVELDRWKVEWNTDYHTRVWLNVAARNQILKVFVKATWIPDLREHMHDIYFHGRKGKGTFLLRIPSNKSKFNNENTTCSRFITIRVANLIRITEPN